MLVVYQIKRCYSYHDILNNFTFNVTHALTMTDWVLGTTICVCPYLSTGTERETCSLSSNETKPSACFSPHRLRQPLLHYLDSWPHYAPLILNFCLKFVSSGYRFSYTFTRGFVGSVHKLLIFIALSIFQECHHICVSIST